MASVTKWASAGEAILGHTFITYCVSYHALSVFVSFLFVWVLETFCLLFVWALLDAMFQSKNDA